MMTEIIPKVPATVRKAWETSAELWRLPFWDWASKKVRPDDTKPATTKLIYDVPLISKYPEIDVLDYQKADANITVKIENPMYKYTIPGPAQMGSYGINDVQANAGDDGFRTIPVRPSFHLLYFLAADMLLVLQVQKHVPLGGLCTPTGRNPQQLGRWHRQQRTYCRSSPSGQVVRPRRRGRATRRDGLPAL